jgi:hypothetical protein
MISKLYYLKVYINTKSYNLEVLYDSASNSIFHFKYTRDAIWNLLEIIK